MHAVMQPKMSFLPVVLLTAGSNADIQFSSHAMPWVKSQPERRLALSDTVESAQPQALLG